MSRADSNDGLVGKIGTGTANSRSEQARRLGETYCNSRFVSEEAALIFVERHDSTDPKLLSTLLDLNSFYISDSSQVPHSGPPIGLTEGDLL